MKKLFCILLSLIMVLSLAACGEEESSGRKNKDKDKVSSSAADKREKVNKVLGQLRIAFADHFGLKDPNVVALCWIVDFPFYEWDEGSDKLDFGHNPFSMPQGGLEALETMNPCDIKAYQYDIVCNGVELSSGAVRNHDIEIMKKAFEIAGYEESELKKRFNALYTAFQYGAPPHAGMAPGIDRMVMLLTDEEKILDVIAFPLNGNAQDLLLGAPSEVKSELSAEFSISSIVTVLLPSL